jgi:hypothetical protein
LSFRRAQPKRRREGAEHVCAHMYRTDGFIKLY